MPFIRINALKYFYREQGTGAPLVFLHGFTGSSYNWLQFLDIFSDQFHVVLLDLPGHGRTSSPADPERYSMDLVSHDLITIFQALNLSNVNLLGYSMGGRLAIYMAVKYPTYFKSLIIESASPGLESAALRQARIKSDNRLASDIEEIGIPEFIERWQQMPLFSTQKGLSVEQKENLRLQRFNNTAIGLANTLRGMGTGQQPSLWSELNTIHLPVLILAGELDQKFSSIARQITATIPNAELNIITGAGHNIHLEKSQRFISSVLDFLARSK